MRKIAFGYSNRCNIRCTHCVAADEIVDDKKEDGSPGPAPPTESSEEGKGDKPDYKEIIKMNIYSWT